jgi:outer membrane protein
LLNVNEIIYFCPLKKEIKSLKVLTMKKISKAFLVVVLMSLAFTTTAQKAQKIGHVDFPALIQAMPGQDSINKAYEAYARGLENQLSTMQAELENKQMDYEANKATMSNIIRQTKERELQDLYNRLMEFQQTAQSDLGEYEGQLLDPLVEKARKAVNEVAKENGYTYILNTAQGMVLYSESGDDITPLVKEKLGIE